MDDEAINSLQSAATVELVWVHPEAEPNTSTRLIQKYSNNCRKVRSIYLINKVLISKQCVKPA